MEYSNICISSYFIDMSCFLSIVLGSISLLTPGGGFGIWGSNSDFHALTWNMAAINNNPFEYWITAEDPSYNRLMKDVSNFIQSPGSSDVAVSSVFTQVLSLVVICLIASIYYYIFITRTCLLGNV